MRQQGRLTEWNDERGFGFVTSLDGESRAFVHVSAFPHEMRRPEAVDLLTYETRLDDRGRLQAVAVKFLAPVARRGTGSKRSPRPSGSAPGEIPIWIPLGLLASVFLGGLLLRATVAAGLLAGYVLLSLVTFVAYAVDKSAAEAGRYRTPESTLHLLEIGGGWPGALIAQRLFRHKTKKRSYQIVFWVCVAANVVGLVLAIAMYPLPTAR